MGQLGDFVEAVFEQVVLPGLLVGPQRGCRGGQRLHDRTRGESPLGAPGSPSPPSGKAWNTVSMAVLTDAQARPVMIAAGLEPVEPYPGNGRAPWKCHCTLCGKEVKLTYRKTRERAGRRGCQACCSDTIDPKKAKALMRKAGLEPQEPYRSTTTKWRCLCKVCGKKCAETYRDVSRRAGRRGCQACCSDAIDPKKAKALMRKAGLEPQEPYKNAATKWKCRCLICKKTCAVSYEDASSRKSGKGCPSCASGKLDTTRAEAKLATAGLKPLEPYPGSQSKWKCVCKTCKGAVVVRISSVKEGTTACRYCAEPTYSFHSYDQFDYKAPAVLYLIVHDGLKAANIGVTHSTDSYRLWEHEEEGWRVCKTWNLSSGADAKLLKQAVLDRWRQGDARRTLTGRQMPQGGHSETAFLADIDIAKTIASVKPSELPKRRTR